MTQNKAKLEIQDVLSQDLGPEKIVGKGYPMPPHNPCPEGMERIPKHGQHNPCIICNRHVKFKQHWTVELLVGGGFVASQSHQALTDQSDGGYMACFPVGPECAKLFPKDALFRSNTPNENGDWDNG